VSSRFASAWRRCREGVAAIAPKGDSGPVCQAELTILSPQLEAETYTRVRSHIATAREMHVRHNFSRRLVLAAIDELAAFLNDQRLTLAKKAGLDEESFIRTVESLRADLPATDAVSRPSATRIERA
jgi:hypothetical protein